MRTRNWLIWGERGINESKEEGESLKVRRRNWLIWGGRGIKEGVEKNVNEKE